MQDGRLIEHVGTHPHNGDEIEETVGEIEKLLVEKRDRYAVIIYACLLERELRDRKTQAAVALSERMKALNNASIDREVERRVAEYQRRKKLPTRAR